MTEHEKRKIRKDLQRQAEHINYIGAGGGGGYHGGHRSPGSGCGTPVVLVLASMSLTLFTVAGWWL